MASMDKIERAGRQPMRDFKAGRYLSPTECQYRQAASVVEAQTLTLLPAVTLHNEPILAITITIGDTEVGVALLSSGGS
jgi:hypothetical protein